MAMRWSLARKTLVALGPAVVLLAVGALGVPWVRLASTVDRAQLAACRQLADLWEQSLLIDPAILRALRAGAAEEAETEEVDIQFVEAVAWSERTGPFSRSVTRAFEAGEAELTTVRREEGARVYQLARRIEGGDGARSEGVLLITLESRAAASQLLVDRVYLILAAVGAVAVSLGVLFVLLGRVVLRPVRALRASAEAARGGRLSVRSPLATGDEFEDLSGTFNEMLETIEEKQEQLRRMNRSLDMQLNELAERNVALYEAARLKSEFVASVSHELRTPLNSIIGFAEILREIAESSVGADEVQLAKRKRYLENIVGAGRTLLEMIEELLTMARIDAGTIEVHEAPVSVHDLCEALAGLISPLAGRKAISLVLELDDALGAVRTDPTKLQQILFNFLSNAVKFTPEGGRVTLRAERLVSSDGEPRVRISVHDTGPGIAPEWHEKIFERFHQVDGGVERAHGGTGLGLAISRELAELLGCEIQLVSEVGRGSMFAVIVGSGCPGDSSG